MVEEVFDFVQVVRTEENAFPSDDDEIAVPEDDHTTRVLHLNLLLGGWGWGSGFLHFELVTSGLDLCRQGFKVSD